MIWSTNSSKLAAATLSTLFFAGALYAPQALVPSDPVVKEFISLIDSLAAKGVGNLPNIPNNLPLVNIEHYLQAHFLLAFRHLARRIHEAVPLRHVVLGFDTLNEPSPGYLGRPNLRQHEELEDLRLGD